MAMTVGELRRALGAYPDELPVKVLIDYGTGTAEQGIGSIVDSSEWDEGNDAIVYLAGVI